MNEDFLMEFLVTVLAIVAGLVVGKKLSVFMNQKGIPIAAGNPSRCA